MSVYTVVSPEVCQEWLKQHYQIGQFQTLEPIAAGIENTNYFLTTDAGAFVLTVYERVDHQRLTFSLEMMRALAERDVACPEPKITFQGTLFSDLLQKPAGIATRLKGSCCTVTDLTNTHIQQAAQHLACMHNAASTWKGYFKNPRGIEWRDEVSDLVRPFLNEVQLQLLDETLLEQREFEQEYLEQLPQGAIHADYFHDNVLFDKGKLEGVIDFGFAGTDAYAYDLAIAINDWCWSREDHQIHKEFYEAFIQSYQQHRPLTGTEKTLWPWLLQRAALRFWLSRLHDLHLPRAGSLVHAHDPAHFERILRYHAMANMAN